MRGVVDGFSVVFSNWTSSIASAYCALVNTPDKVTDVSVRVQAIPLARVPLAAEDPSTNKRSPVVWLVSVIAALAILSLSPSKIELSVSAIDTAAPFSVNVAVQSLSVVSAVVTVVVTEVVVVAVLLTDTLSKATSSVPLPEDPTV